MKSATRVFVLSLLCSLFSVLPAQAQLLNARFISSVYTWEKFDTVDVSKTHVRGVQSVILDVAQSDFSLHTHLQGATALQRTLDETPDFRAYYLYARYRNIGNAIDISFGRLPFFVGVGTGTLDGALTSVRLTDNTWKFTLYGGRNVPRVLDFKVPGQLKTNFTVGGQVIATGIPNTRLALSYMNRNRDQEPYEAIRPDSLFNPMTTLVTPDPAKEQYISGDISYRWDVVNLYGRYDYDLNFERTQRGQIGLRGDVNPDLRVSLDFIHRAPRVAYNTFFGVFNTSTINEFEGGADYILNPCWRVFGRGALVSYTDDETFRYTVGVAHTYGGLTYRGNSGYAGDINGLTLHGAYPLCERRFIPNAALSYASYKLNESAPDETVWSAVLGATYRPVQLASLDVQVQWLTNKVVDRDVRLFAKLNIWFSEQLNIFN